jgi:hypothetical protein
LKIFFKSDDTYSLGLFNIIFLTIYDLFYSKYFMASLNLLFNYGYFYIIFYFYFSSIILYNYIIVSSSIVSLSYYTFPFINLPLFYLLKPALDYTSVLFTELNLSYLLK